MHRCNVAPGGLIVARTPRARFTSAEIDARLDELVVQQEALDFVAQGTANGAHRGRAPAPPRKVLQHPRGLRRHRREVSVAVAARSQSTRPSKFAENSTKFVPAIEMFEQERMETLVS